MTDTRESAMADLPSDDMKRRAWEIVSMASGKHSFARDGWAGVEEGILHALLATRREEREACAKIAEMHDHRGDIAAAIRSQK